MPTFAAGSQHSVKYIAESVWGSLPSPADTTLLRHKSCSLGLSKDTFTSAELRNDRMISDLRHGNQKVQGDLGVEFSWKEYDALLESALFGAWNANVLKAGVTQKSFCIERAFGDIAKYLLYKGCVADKFSLSVKPNAIVDGTFSFIGKEAATPAGTSIDSSPTASQTESPYDSFTGTVSEGGSSIAVLTGIDITLNNGLAAAMVVGSDLAASLVPGRSNLTGTISAFFANTTLLEKFINETPSSIQFVLGAGGTKSYTFLIPNVKYTGGGDINVSGEGAVGISMPFQALLDSVTTSTSLQITRTAS